MINYVIRSSYGNDSVALIQWAREQQLTNVCVLYNDTGWAHRDWHKRVALLEVWVSGLGFQPVRTRAEGFDNLVRRKSGFPRQGIQFCTQELKIAPTIEWWDEYDPHKTAVSLIGVRREESNNRKNYPEFSISPEGISTWAPLVAYTEYQRDTLLRRARVKPLPHRSAECFPCINSNRKDILLLDETTIAKVETLENSMGYTSKGKPRTFFRPYRYMGATGIREIVRWAKAGHGKFELDDGNGSPGCEAGWCGG